MNKFNVGDRVIVISRGVYTFTEYGSWGYVVSQEVGCLETDEYLGEDDVYVKFEECTGVSGFNGETFAIDANDLELMGSGDSSKTAVERKIARMWERQLRRKEYESL